MKNQAAREALMAKARENKDTRRWAAFMKDNIHTAFVLLAGLSLEAGEQLRRDVLTQYKWWDSLSMMLGQPFTEKDIALLLWVAESYTENRPIDKAEAAKVMAFFERI